MSIPPFAARPLPGAVRAAFRLLVVLLLLVAPAWADHYLPRHRVLLLNSYHPGYVWSDGIENAIRTELARADSTIELLTEHLDTKHFDAKQLFPELEKFFSAKYRQRQPDVLIAADDAALQFLLARRERLFPGVPLVFCGINNFSDDMIAGQERITGVAENADIAGTIGLILHLQPHIRQIAFISDSGESGKINRQRFQTAARHYQGQVTFVELSDLTLTELQTALRQLPADAAILHTTMFRDRDGTTMTPAGSVALLTEHSTRPFYGMWEHGIGDAGVGGIITSAALQGETAAAMALRILNGEAPETIPVVRDAPTRPVFNYPALRRYEIDEARLPAGSVVRERPVSFYQEHAAIVWTVGVGFVLLSSLVVALMINIMRRQQAMMLLRTRKNQLRQIIDSMPVGVFLADGNGQLIMSNSAGVKIWGGEQKVGIAEYGVYKGCWAESGQPLAATEWGMARAIRNGETSLDELIDIEAFDGERKTISHSALPLRDTNGDIIGGLVVIQDVTERLRGERTLLALANEWQNTFDALNDAIVLLDRDFRVMHCNRAFLRLTEMQPWAVHGRHCWELVHHGTVPIKTCPFARMLESGRSESAEYEDRGRWWETRVDPILDDGGALYGAIHIISEITERKQAELERQGLITQLEQRNAELERFTYSVSHDLKTPLVTINGFVGQLREDLARNDLDCIAVDLDFIESSARQMAALLDSLLHLARSGRVIADPRPVDLPRIVREALATAGGVLDEGMTVRLDFAADLPPVPGDGERLREVFQNLIENAAKFCRNRPNAEIEIGGRLDGRQAFCWVRDNGVGIPPQYLERIFVLFERLDNSTPGTGIGLSLARRIVEKHGGRIWAESAGEGQGSTFFVILPVSLPPVA